MKFNPRSIPKNFQALEAQIAELTRRVAALEAKPAPLSPAPVPPGYEEAEPVRKRRG
jgi:hypothetical protein